jgi:GNAT superfamily N-acetyltransferase
MDIAFRPAVGSDIPYIKNSWLESYRNGDGVRGIPNTFYYHYEELLLRKTIPRCSNSNGLVIAYEHSHDMEYIDTIEADILGWICAEALETGLLVHYCYVRGFDSRRNKKIAGKTRDYRRQGIASALLEHVRTSLNTIHQPVYYTYRTNVCWDSKEGRDALEARNCTYLPYPKWTLTPHGWETGTPGNEKTVR